MIAAAPPALAADLVESLRRLKLVTMREQAAEVLGSAPKGVRVQVYGLNGLLPFGQISGVKRNTPPEVVAAKVQRAGCGMSSRSPCCGSTPIREQSSFPSACPRDVSCDCL
jgi:hypothetical protein